MTELNQALKPYQRSDFRRGLIQLLNTLLPYFGLWYLMILSLDISYWLTVPLVLLASLFLMRLFIIFHDCGHNSFFSSKNLNRRIGSLLGVLVFTPGEHWWHAHAVHHATSGNLDKRGIGDVETMTQTEYLEAKWGKKLGYRFFRNPIIMFGLGPIFMFLIMHRLNFPHYGKKERRSVLWTNLAIVVIAVLMSLLVGWIEYLTLQLAVMWLAGGFGIWMFYLQHQFEETYWERDQEWNYVSSALLGASYYRLPRILQWFTGNIGFHHIHHLSPRIPNYFLDKAHDNSPLIQRWTYKIDFLEGWKTVGMKLWNESRKTMEGFPRRERMDPVEARPRSGD